MGSSFIRRLTGLAVSALALAACVTTLAASSAGGATLPSEPLVPYIIGGQQASISQFPWQGFVLLYVEEGGSVIEGSCGGSILNATTILTAAHCVDREGTTTSYPVTDFVVVAGASNISEVLELRTPPGSQYSFLSSFRTDPLYTIKPEIKDDIAVLTLKTPLELSSARNTQAISLVGTGATPAPGTALSISGYGKQQGAEGVQPNGDLYSASLTAISSDACRNDVGLNSAVLMCAISTTSSTCQGDSGGPLTEGSPAVQVGIVDFGAKECPLGVPDVFSNVAAPEIRAFIEGSESPPVAARPTSLPAVKSVGAAPVDLSPLSGADRRRSPTRSRWKTPPLGPAERREQHLRATEHPRGLSAGVHRAGEQPRRGDHGPQRDDALDRGRHRAAGRLDHGAEVPPADMRAVDRRLRSQRRGADDRTHSRLHRYRQVSCQEEQEGQETSQETRLPQDGHLQAVHQGPLRGRLRSIGEQAALR